MSEPHARLSEAMNERRIDLRKSWKQVAQDAGISYEALRAIRRGGYRPSAITARQLDEALRWPQGTVERTLEGDEPETDQPAPSHDETLAEIRRTLAALRQDLRDHLGDRNQTVGDALIDGLEALVEESTSETPKP